MPSYCTSVHASSPAGSPSVCGSIPLGQHASPVASSRAAVSASGYAHSSSPPKYTRHAPASSGRMTKVPMLLCSVYALVDGCVIGVSVKVIRFIAASGCVAINCVAKGVA